MAVFQGPQTYVTPSWYETKQETGRVVPTWNYATVHVWGRPRVIDDEAWLRGQIEDLTNFNEASRPAPWQVADAPEDYVSALIKGIVGRELPIGRIEGKWKVSQNRPPAERQGVVRGLGELGPSGEPMAALVAAGGPVAEDASKPNQRRRPLAMQDVTTSEDVPMSAEEVWAVIGDFSGIRKWATLVEKATTRETPKGKVRTLTMPGGRTVEELLIDQDDLSYTYSLDRPDMNAYRSTVSVEPTGTRTSRIVLVARFDPKDPEQTEALKEGFGKFHRGNLKAMKRALGLA